MMLPLIRPMTGASLLITSLGCWNNFIGPQIVLQSPDKFPLAVAIAPWKELYSTGHGLLMAGTVVSIAPVMALFLRLQREFISRLTQGAVKGRGSCSYSSSCSFSKERRVRARAVGA